MSQKSEQLAAVRSALIAAESATDKLISAQAAEDSASDQLDAAKSNFSSRQAETASALAVDSDARKSLQEAFDTAGIPAVALPPAPAPEPAPEG